RSGVRQVPPRTRGDGDEARGAQDGGCRRHHDGGRRGGRRRRHTVDRSGSKISVERRGACGCRRPGGARSLSGGDPRRGGDVNPQQIQQMMKQAQQMQERLQKEMAALSVEASAGGGMVTATLNGAKQLLAIKIDPEVVSKDDIEMLQDLIVAAVND